MAEEHEADALPEGARLAHYVVRRRLGGGGMGTVYEAHDESLDRTVALKVMHVELAGETRMAERFAREARAAARASHENLAHVYFVGSADGRPFYAMEYVPGEDLQSRVDREGPLPLAQAIDVLLQAARGLEAAHAVGVIHRDVKPSNLIREPSGRVKVTDFGLAKSVEGDPSASHAGHLTGTPTYMSPEQVRGESVDPRTDVYALGLVGWFLLAGRPAFPGPTLGAVLADQMNSPLPSLAHRREDVPETVEKALQRLCAKDPARRPASMAEVIALLEDVRPREVVPAPFAARAAALAVDALVFTLVVGALSHVVTLLERWMGANPLLTLVAYGLSGVVAIASQWGMEVRRGASIGKRMFHLKVVRADGAAPSRRALAARFLIRFPSIPAAFLPDAPRALVVLQAGFGILQVAALIAGVAVFLVTQQRTLSDVWTRTRVAFQPGA